MNNYESISIIGRGAHGVCHLCRRIGDTLRQKVVIKKIAIDGVSTAEESAIMGEVKLLQVLQHPNIIGYYEYFLESGSLCIVMQYAEGGTMAQMLVEQKEKLGMTLPHMKVIDYFTQIVIALNYMHSKQVLHRDLKTQNILLNRRRTICKLSDFGISKQLNTRSQASTLIGTPSYLSPEICEGRAYNHKSDIWSLGCILYELVALRRAFDGQNVGHLVIKITTGKFEPLGDEVSRPLKVMVAQLLHLNENRRPDLKDILVDPLILPHALRICLDLGVIQPDDGASSSPPVIATSSRPKMNGNRPGTSGTEGK